MSTWLGNIGACFADLTLQSFVEGNLFAPPTANLEIRFTPPSQNMAFVASLQSTDNETVDEAPIIPLFTGKILNFPNPFSMKTGTQIGYQLNHPTTIELRIYSISGYLFFQKIYLSTEEGGMAKYNHITIDASTLSGAWLSPGVYIYAILSEGKVLAKNKMVVTP